MPNKAKLTTRERSSSNVSSDNLNKGSELSFAEVDSNFINLRDQSIAISDGSTTTDIDAGETITFSGASVSGNTVTITGGSSSASGGNLADLQVNGTTLSPVSTNDDLNLTANGTGVVDVVNAKFSTGTATVSSHVTTFNTIDGGSSSGPSRLLLKATGGTNAVGGRDLNTIHFESHSGNYIFQKTGGGTPNITTEIGGAQEIQISALEALNESGIVINGNTDGKITMGQAVDVGVLTFAKDGVISTPATGGANTLTITTQGNGNMELAAETITINSSVNVNMETFHIRGNEIRTSQSNADIMLIPNGTGGIQMQTAKVIITNLPTSNPGVAGQLYNDSGTLKIS
tara:strand:- start:176 stop:1210 length:1035 start_codon:yes stop_codon:yes gene_type:complete